MPELQRGSTSNSIIDVLDRVLDKGIVIDAWVRVSLVGIDLVTLEARVVVASIETYVNRAGPVAQLAPISRPCDQQSGNISRPAEQHVVMENQPRKDARLADRRTTLVRHEREQRKGALTDRVAR